MKRLILPILLALTVLAPSVASATTVSMTLTGAGGNGVMGGVYIGPYTALIDGQSFKVICDDFLAETYINESWTANVITFSQLDQAKFGATSNYQGAAWLALKMLNSTNNAEKGAIQFALWEMFTPGAFNWLTAAQKVLAQEWLNKANDLTYSAGLDLSNFVIYRPTSAPGTCSGGPCPTPTPQEFIGIRSVPEPGTLVLLGTGLIGTIAARRRRRR